MILEISPTINIFGIQISWYAICIMTGIIIAAICGYREGERLGIKKSDILDGLLYCVPLCILGARIYYVIFDWGTGWNLLEIIGFSDGKFVGLRGLAINGAIITAALFVIFFCKKRKINFWNAFDILAPGFLIGQICGRWGNFFNQEAFGPVTSLETLSRFLPSFIVNQMYIDGAYHHPTFLYESMWNLLGLILILIFRRTKLIKVGDFFGFYLIWYGLYRGLVIEPMRQDPLMLGDIKINIVINVVLALLGVIFIVIKRKAWFYEKFGLENKLYYDKLQENTDGKYGFI